MSQWRLRKCESKQIVSGGKTGSGLPEASGTGRQEEPERPLPAPLGLHLGNMLLGAGLMGEDMLGAALDGLSAWRRHPFRRPAVEPPVLAAEGASRLLDFGRSDERAATVLLVPSLVNPAFVLDLLPGASLVEELRNAGLRPVLLDWGSPGAAEADYGVDACVGRLLRLAETLAGESADRVHLVGYCMGGTLTLAAALLRPDLFARLALLAAPWDFHAGDHSARRLAGLALPAIPLFERLPAIGPEMAGAFFAALSPLATLKKFARFSQLDPASPEARIFVALEDWANGGPPLAAGVAIEVLRDWYALNRPAAGLWRIDGTPVDPARLALPVLAAVPRADRIVPPEGALGLAGGLVADLLLRPTGGHVGMVVGRRAADELRRPLARWLLGTL